mmetsp:Transcript_35997/g.95556  ORF Transcript_35997/g.95556 Transcript_35997/m.95556 type:complete len:105 (-) Transcript_35997:56-370(-)
MLLALFVVFALLQRTSAANVARSARESCSDYDTHKNAQTHCHRLFDASPILHDCLRAKKDPLTATDVAASHDFCVMSYCLHQPPLTVPVSIIRSCKRLLNLDEI